MTENQNGKQAKMEKNELYIQKAQALIPNLHHVKEVPISCLEYDTSAKCLTIPDQTVGKPDGFGKGERIIFDFGQNHAAYFQFTCRSVGSPQDAPAFLHIKFCELEKEIPEDSSDYNGWISKGWLQEEWLHIDEMPRQVKMERRYAFRYAVITVLDTSLKFRVVFEDVERTAVSAVRTRDAAPFLTDDPLLKQIDAVSVRTLANCMQTVFEDGPKRDRRLWLGDLRLQALTNYKTFGNQNLVKRCLYLFAGLRNKDGMIPACVFERPNPHMDDSFLLDYALFFIPLLLEYYENTSDHDTLAELAPHALHQLDIAMEYVNGDGTVCEEGRYHCFIDWNSGLDKQCSMQAVFIYCLEFGEILCKLIHDKEQGLLCTYRKEQMISAARKTFWDSRQQVFISGPARQVSYASQVWMILARVVQGQEAAELLDRVSGCPISMVTPYMHHFYVQALLLADEREKAIQHLKRYWGGMIQAGADTFWELYNPENEAESPYGSASINSYCHAWSCSPAYLLREMQHGARQD